MSKHDKIIKRILAKDQGLRFKEIKKILESYGYIGSYPNGGSSHCTFRKKGENPITIPTHEPIKQVYLLMIEQLVKKEENI